MNRTPPRLATTLVVVVMTSVASGCIAARARVAAGPTVDTDGAAGYQVTASLGFGYATRESGVTGRTGFATSDRAGAALSSDIEYVHVGKSIVSSVGVSSELGLSTEAAAVWLAGAALVPLWRKDRRDRGHEKMGFGGTNRAALSIGLEGRAGAVTAPSEDSRGLFGVLAAIDFTMLSTMDL